MTTEWDECLGETDSWLLKPLLHQLRYERPLPVQQAVIPAVRRALLGGFPMDVCLTAPTGSGKTLCYLLPLLSLVAECKKGVDHTRLRALLLVPTKALGTQLFRELLQLTRGTSIAVESLCKGELSVKEESEAIVRAVTVLEKAPISSDFETGETNINGTGKNVNGVLTSNGSSNVVDGLSSRVCYYSRVDILISTPQRLLRHLDSTAGLSLVDLRFLVIDEADQVLVGNFANFVAKVLERFEEEQMARLENVNEKRRLVQLTYSLHKMLCSATLSSHIARISEVRLRNCCHFALDSFGSNIHCEDEGEPLQLSTNNTGNNGKRKGKKGNRAIEEDGDDNDDGEKVTLPISRRQLVRTSFALPPSLQEHVVFVEDWYRHAVLLKLVRTIISKVNGNKVLETVDNVKPAVVANEEENSPHERDKEEKKTSDSNGCLTNNYGDSNNNNDDNEESEEDGNCVKEVDSVDFLALGYCKRQKQRQQRKRASLQFGSLSTDYPSCDDDAGRRILIFCRTAEEARVMGHFLLSAGVQATEFTTLATDSERRRALLKSSSDACIVASDALMRGVDVPNVGHVIMYSPPETLSQYVHRAGRTARAMRAGHLHLLLQKNGPSGTQSDGEVAVFKALSAAVARTQPVRYERHFFMFDRPLSNSTTRGSSECAGNNLETTESDSALLLVKEADEYLKKTKAQLSMHWASALECNKKKVNEVSRNVAAADNKTRIQGPPPKKERRE